MRSGTLQYLHISEFGKICTKYPDKAQEIVTGALNTVQAGQIITIESTAEGRHGYFYDYCRKAQGAIAEGRELSQLDFKFFFFPWWSHPEYRLDPATVLITQDMQAYFDSLKSDHGIELTPDQAAWYAKKAEMMGDDMLREFPSTPEEAFASSIKGAYYAPQMARVRKDKRLVPLIPVETDIPVNTGWDLGMDDQTAVWFHQRVGHENRIVDYYENQGEGLEHYVRMLQARGYLYGQHYLPHDVAVRDLSTGKSRAETLERMGLSNINIVSGQIRVEDGIEAVRNLLATCWFDASRCAPGIAALDAYQREWDDKAGGFKSRPLHNWASHAADAFRTFAVGYSPHSTTKSNSRPRRRDARVV